MANWRPQPTGAIERGGQISGMESTAEIAMLLSTIGLISMKKLFRRVSRIFSDPKQRTVFFSGGLRVYDLSGASYHMSRKRHLTDSAALRADWQRVGDYLYYAMGQIDEEMRTAKRSQTELFACDTEPRG